MKTMKAIALGTLMLSLAGCPEVGDGGGAGVGGRIAFIRDGRLTVSSDDGFGTGEQFLTDPDTSADPALSPNGQTIAFAYAPAGGDQRGIYAVPSSGTSQPVALAEPAGSATFGSPAWSPDGSTIVFVSTDGADTKLLRVSSSGGSAEEVAQGLVDVNFPAFLDANTLVVLKGLNNELQSLDLTSGQLTALGLNTGSRAAVAPDGGRIAYANFSDEIVIVNLQSGEPITIPSTTTGTAKPAFSPDGTLVAFQGASPVKLFQTTADGAGAVELLQSGADVSWGL